MTAVTLVTATLGTWVSGGFVEVDAVHAPGLYEFGVPNASLTSGNAVEFYFQGATNMATITLQLQLDAIDNQDSVRGGLTSLPNALPGANGGLPTTNASNQVLLNLTQSIPTSNTAQTLGDCLNAARAQGFGKWVQSGTTFAIYAPDGTTVVRSFALDSGSAPTQRV
jgi:hypothetical protein